MGNPAPRWLAASAYRTLGLPGGATQAQIDQAARRLRIWPDPNICPATPWDLPRLGPISRSKNDIEQALSALNEPRSRIEQRLFWLQAESPPRWAELNVRVIGFALRDANWGAVSAHDLALVRLQLAWLRDPDFRQPRRWTGALQQLEQVAALPDYLAWLLEVERNGDFDKPARPDEISTMLGAMTQPVIESLVTTAQGAIEDDRPEAALRLVEILRTCRGGDSASRAVLERLEDVITRRSLRIIDELKRTMVHDRLRFKLFIRPNRRACKLAASEYKRVVHSMAQLRRLDGPKSEHVERAQTSVARAIAYLAYCWTWAGQSKAAMDLLNKGLASTRNPAGRSIIVRQRELVVQAQKDARRSAARSTNWRTIIIILAISGAIRSVISTVDGPKTTTPAPLVIPDSILYGHRLQPAERPLLPRRNAKTQPTLGATHD